MKILDLSWNQIGKYGERSIATMAVSDIKNALVQERKINLKLQAENDKLRVS